MVPYQWSARTKIWSEKDFKLGINARRWIINREIQEQLIELQNDKNCKDAFESDSLSSFGIKKQVISYTKIREIALRYLMLFPTIYLCEQEFSALLIMKNKSRNRLKISDDMRVALCKNITPRIQEIVQKMQAQKSHWCKLNYLLKIICFQ